MVGGRRPGAAVRCAALAASGVLALPALAGCGLGTGDDETLGGFGLPVVPEEGVPGARGEVTGVLRVERNGCFTLEYEDGARPWVIWPRTARHDGAEVVLGDGTAVGDGTRLVGSGARLGADALPGWDDEDTYLGSFGRFCEAGDVGVVVLDEVRPVA